MTTNIQWQYKSFTQLSVDQLYDLLKLRTDVFVVEQDCVYSDLDSGENTKDRHEKTIHLMGYNDNQLIAYLRILDKGQSYPQYVSIGRVVTVRQNRGKGIGHELLFEAINLCQKYFPKQSIKISAQQHLKSYYEQHGFEVASQMYLEDGIPHIAMVKAA